MVLMWQMLGFYSNRIDAETPGIPRPLDTSLDSYMAGLIGSLSLRSEHQINCQGF